MSYAQFNSQVSVFQSVTESAWSTLQVLDRQARKDTVKVGNAAHWLAQVLTSRQAVKTYRMVWKAVVIAGMVAIALGSTVRELLDGYVAQCEAQSSEIPDVQLPSYEELFTQAEAIGAEPEVEEEVQPDPADLIPVYAPKAMADVPTLVIPVEPRKETRRQLLTTAKELQVKGYSRLGTEELRQAVAQARNA